MSLLYQPDRRSLIGAGIGVLAGAHSLRSVGSNLLIRNHETVTVTDRGASLEGLAAAFREVGRYGGGVVRLATGPITLRTTELLAGGPLLLPENTTLEGEGVSVMVAGTGTSPPLFVARNVSGIRLRNLVATSNRRAIADTRSGTFALFEQTAAATAPMENIVLENIALTGFAGERWVQFLQRAPHLAMSGLRIDDLRAGAGGSVAPSAIGVSAAVLWVHGLGGTIRDVVVRRLCIDAAGMKQGCVLFHKVSGAVIEAATITEAGARGASDDAGAYAIMAYADPGEMSDIVITSPTIRAPRSAGIYLRGATKVRITDASIDGQTDRISVNLPKGAIALNGCSSVSIAGGRLSGNVTDISVADGGLTTLDLDVDGVRTDGSSTSALLAISPGAGAISGVRFTDCALSGRDRVFRVMNEQVPGRFYDNVWLRGGTYGSATAASIIELTQGVVTNASDYRIENVTVQAARVGIMATGLQGSLTIRNTIFEGLAAMDYGIVADDCPRLDWSGIAFRGVRPAFAYSARSIRRRANGRIEGLVWPTGIRPATPGSLADSR